MAMPQTTALLGLLGEGKLHEALRQSLTSHYRIQELGQETILSAADRCQLIITCHDCWSATQCNEVLALGKIRQVAWFPIYSEFDALFIGPCTQPDTPGCFACSEQRRQCAIEEIEIFRGIREQVEQDEQRLSQPWLTPWIVATLLPFIEAEIAACLQAPEKSRTSRTVMKLKLSTLEWEQHRFLPDPACDLCGNLPLDSADAARVQLQPREKLALTTFRVRSLSPLAEHINEAYVDTDFGLVHQLSKRSPALCPITTAYTFMEQRGRRRILSGTGRTLNYKQSNLTAITENLERFGGQSPRGKRTGVRASFRQLGEQALNPVTLGLPTPEQYAQPDHPRVPYHQDLVCDWVWGYSFGQQRALLVPEFYAYYGFPEKQAFAYETSNGCALGSCLEEAILYALLEVLERDAFLLTWYAQLDVPRLDHSSIPDQRIKWLIEYLEYASGYKLSLFNTTLLHGVPCCCAIAVDEDRRADFPRMVCSAGSHLLPEEAVLSALLELTAMLPQERLRDHVQERFRQNRHHALEMLHDPLQVREMTDHLTLYMLPEAFSRLDFLVCTPHQQTFQEAFGAFMQAALSPDLTEDLNRLIACYWKQDIDTIVVDQTAPEHRELGFHCVKVIMPGMLPMTFGHQNRRASGFERLAEWPMLLGYRSQPLADAEINPHPHPFA